MYFASADVKNNKKTVKKSFLNSLYFGWEREVKAVFLSYKISKRRDDSFWKKDE